MQEYIKRKINWIGEHRLLWLIILLSAIIRFYYSFHIFLSDEVFNLITIEALAAGNGLTEYFFRHPPLYVLLSSFFYFLIGHYPQYPSFISIIFSAFSLIPFFLITELLFGRKVGLLASLFLSIMPANLYYSTWIKQDAMLLFFFLMALYFYLKRHYLSAGIYLGIALLVKEFALFFFPLSILLLWSEPEKRLEDWYGLMKMFVISIILSCWWYVLFGSSFYQVTSEALTGWNLEEAIWHFSWWFYIKNMPYDFSFIIFSLFLIGFVSLIKEHIYGHFGGYTLPIAWIIVFYLPLSFVTVKAPWYIYLATPPAAIIAAYGLVKLEEYVSRVKIAISVIYLSILLFLALLFNNFNTTRYFERVTGFPRPQIAKDVQGSNWIELMKRKELWTDKVSGVEKIAFLEFHPILQYLMGISDMNVIFLKSNGLMNLDKDGILKLTMDYNIGAYVIYTESLMFTEKNLEDLRYLWGEPLISENLMLFLTKPLSKHD